MNSNAVRHHTPISTGINISYLEVGQGPTLLLIHGYPGTAESHLGSVIDDLSRDYHIIAPDLRGYGASRPPNRDFPVDFYPRDAADMAALLDALQTGPIGVLGFSDGGETALLLAATRPDLVRVVISWGVCGVISGAMVESIADWLPVSAWGPEREGRRLAIIKRHGAEQFEPIVRGWYEAAHAIHDRGGNVCLDEASRILAPALVMNGAREVGNPPEDAAALVERIPRGELVFIDDSGHYIQDDQPAALLAQIRAFLVRHGP